MKKKYLASLLFGLLFVNTACEEVDKNEIYQEDFHKILYLKNTGVMDVTLYKTGEHTDYPVSIVKAGAFPELTADVYLESMTEAELAEYCASRGLDLKKVPESCFSLQERDVHFGSEDRYKIVNMSLHTTAIDELPESSSEYVVPIALKSENDSINANLNVLILKPTVVIPSVSFVNKGLTPAYCSDGTTTVEVPLQLQIDNKWNFTCQVEVDPTVTGHELLDKGYRLENDGIVNFTEGNNTSMLKVTIDREATGYTDLDMNMPVIPLRLKSISIETFDVDKSEMLLGVTSKYPLTPSMLETNAQEPSEGPLADILDGNINTFFHSAWSISIDKKHYVQVNLPKAISSFIFSYTNRATNGSAALAEFDLSVSENGTDFTSMKYFTKDVDNLPGTAAGVFNSPKMDCLAPVKPIRFTCERNWGGNGIYFVWSEFSLYGW